MRRSATRRSRMTSTSGSFSKRSSRWLYSHWCSRETTNLYRTVTQFSDVRPLCVVKIRAALGTSNAAIGAATLLRRARAHASPLAAATVDDDGDSRDLLHHPHEMCVRARLIGRHDEEPSSRRKRVRGKQLQDRLLVPIADAVRLAGVFERLTDAQKVRATFLLTPRT